LAENTSKLRNTIIALRSIETKKELMDVDKLDLATIENHHDSKEEEEEKPVDI